ncbi:MAG: hypothetical protein SD837_21800 [Candidatus Electrothrix scaldis]|nr:MAG: hypothetical protein SD837_21800 [Candidatus Electrothrix sp. GW3-3]
MKIIKFGIGMATCVALSSCANLLPKPEVVKDCYPVDSLSPKERISLQVGTGNPILLAGDKKFVCACYQAGSLLGADEGDRLDRADERDNLDRADEDDNLDRADERASLAKADERASLTKADERASLAKADERASLTKADERASLTKADEGALLAKADEGASLTRADEVDGLSKDSTKLSCRIVSGCPGFQLIGYEPQQITVRTEAGRKSFPTSCITW